MTALSADFDRQISENANYISYPVYQSTTIYKGALVNIVPGTGYLVAATDVANGECVGVADEYVDNSSGSSGDKNCRVKVRGLAKVTLASIAVTDLEQYAYVSDSDTASLTATHYVVIGKIKGFETNIAIIDLGDKKVKQPTVADVGANTGVALTDSSGGTAVATEILALTNMDALTNSTGGTGDTTLAAVSGSGADATINNNFTDIAAQLTKQIAFNTAVKNDVATFARELNAERTAVNALITKVNAMLVVLAKGRIVKDA